ncbi:MAG: sugar-binding protein [Pseudomonadota bacterium]
MTGKPLIATLLLLWPAAPIWAWEVTYAATPPQIDGRDDDAAWAEASWRPIDQVILGEPPEPADFSGRYKLVWTEERLYLLAEIIDDVLLDAEPNPRVSYWNDDALELLIDENRSGGNHHYSYNAFAYHIALDNQVVDIAPHLEGFEGSPRVLTFPDHLTSRWRRRSEAPYTVVWEVSLAVYGDDYSESANPPSTPRLLKAGETLGFMAAYCDADEPGKRDNFLTDLAIEPVNGDRNRAYIDAGVFGPITLAAPPRQ